MQKPIIQSEPRRSPPLVHGSGDGAHSLHHLCPPCFHDVSWCFMVDMPVVNGISETSYRENDRFFWIWMDMRVLKMDPQLSCKLFVFREGESWESNGFGAQKLASINPHNYPISLSCWGCPRVSSHSYVPTNRRMHMCWRKHKNRSGVTSWTHGNQRRGRGSWTSSLSNAISLDELRNYPLVN